jgi:Helicase associated domain
MPGPEKEQRPTSSRPLSSERARSTASDIRAGDQEMGESPDDASLSGTARAPKKRGRPKKAANAQKSTNTPAAAANAKGDAALGSKPSLQDIQQWLNAGTAAGVASARKCSCNAQPPCAECLRALGTERGRLPFNSDTELLGLLRTRLPNALETGLRSARELATASKIDLQAPANPADAFRRTLSKRSWFYRTRTWDSYVNELVEFRELHGHVNVPIAYSGGLGLWLQTQQVRRTLPGDKIRDLKLLGVDVAHIAPEAKPIAPAAPPRRLPVSQLQITKFRGWGNLEKDIFLASAIRNAETKFRAGQSFHVVDLVETCGLELAHVCPCADIQVRRLVAEGGESSSLTFLR